MIGLIPRREELAQQRIVGGAEDSRSFTKTFLGIGQDARNRNRIRKEIRDEVKATRRNITRRNHVEAQARIKQLRRNPTDSDRRELDKRRRDLESHYSVRRYKESDPQFKQAQKYVEAGMRDFVLKREREVRSNFLRRADQERKSVGRDSDDMYRQRIKELEQQYKQVRGTAA